MAITFLEQNELAQSEKYLTRLRQAMSVVATEVITDDSADAHDNTDKYIARKALADSIIANPTGETMSAAYFTATKTEHADSDDITDASLLSTVRGLWDTLSGYNEHQRGHE